MKSKMFDIWKFVIIFNGMIALVESMPLLFHNNLIHQQQMPVLYFFPTNSQMPTRINYIPNRSVLYPIQRFGSSSSFSHQPLTLIPNRFHYTNRPFINWTTRRPSIIIKPVNVWENKHKPDLSRKNTLKKIRPSTVSNEAPGAYNWGYKWLDEFGNQMFREESSDGRGTVRGRYSYRDSNGIMRIVEYIADHNGFRTRIRSNEPGIVTSNPANAQIIRFESEDNIPE